MGKNLQFHKRNPFFLGNKAHLWARALCPYRGFPVSGMTGHSLCSGLSPASLDSRVRGNPVGLNHEFSSNQTGISIRFLAQTLIIFSFLPFFSGAALADESRTVFDTPFSHIAYGGAGVASLKPDLSYLINPSLLARTAGQGAVVYGVKSHRQTALISVTDKHTWIPAGVTFQREWDSRKTEAPLHRWSFSVGSRIVPSFSLGAVIYKETAKNKDPRWNGGAGAVLKLGRRTALAVTLSDILIYESKNHRVFRFGFYSKQARLLSVRGDMSYSVKNRWTVRGGMETLINRFIALRGGGLWSFKERKALFSGGVGFYGPRLQFDYALQRDEALLHHVLTARLFF